MTNFSKMERCTRCSIARGYAEQPQLTFPLPVGIREVAAELRRLNVPLVAFGQTVFWDEASKAVLRRLLDEHAPGILMFAGIHDSDYFSKLHGRGRIGEGFVLRANNDWTNRGLWAAVGETTSLFGAEAPPSVVELQAAGVPLKQMAAQAPEGVDAFLDAATAAYGWRGVAQLGSPEQIARDVLVRDAGESLYRLFKWGLDETLALLADREQRRRAAAEASMLLDRLSRTMEDMTEATVSELYQRLITEHYADLLGTRSDRILATATCDYLRFNRQTCIRARFQALQAFLCRTVAICARETYNDAVEGLGMYDLEQFGEGAIPFDLVVPGLGRGTLRVLDGEVRAEFASGPLSIPTSERVCMVEELAGLLEETVGPNAAIVGKALLGPVMFCSEAILVLHEGASAYVPRTSLWLSRLNNSCGSLRTYPILRLRHHAYDALVGAKVIFRLPEHLAAAFGAQQVTAEEFGHRWKSVAHEQERLLKRLAQARSAAELLAVIAEQSGAKWGQVADDLASARQTLRTAGEQIEQIRQKLLAIRCAERRARRRRAELEARSGQLRRQELQSGDSEPRQALRRLISAITEDIRCRESRRAELRQEIADLANSPAVQSARKRIKEITEAAERERLALARRALLVRHMEVGDRRPTSWWFPVVDPSGAWFEEAVRRAEVYLEDLSSSGRHSEAGQ